MNRAEYCAQVLSHLRRLSRREREAVRAELEAHMEDHVRALLDLGYDAQLAEERTVAAMGDPAEVGREMEKQYPRGWNVLAGVSLVLCVFVILSVFSVEYNRRKIGYAWESVICRISPPEPEEIAADIIWQKPYIPVSGVREEVDIRRNIGNDVLWVYRITVGDQNGQLTAEAAACVYDKIPGGLVSFPTFNELWVESQRGDQQVLCRQGVFANPMMWNLLLRAPVRLGDDHMTLRYDWLGETVAVDIPLPKEGVP